MPRFSQGWHARSGLTANAAGGRGNARRRVGVGEGMANYRIWLVVAPAVLVAVAASAQDSDAAGAAASQGGAAAAATDNAAAFGQGTTVSEGGAAPTAGLAGTSVHPNARPSPFGYGELSYQPSFSGCNSANLNTGSALSNTAAFTELQGAPAPRREPGRYFQLSLSGGETYTDNLNLAPAGQAKSDFITEVSPTLNACASTGRVRGNLTYQLQGVVYHNNSDNNQIYNDVAGDTTIELIPAHFYLGADARYGQSVIDPSASFSRSNAIRPGNQTGTFTTNVSPYYLQSLGPIGDANLRYRYGTTQYGDSDIPDSTLNGVYFNLTNPQYQQTWSWDLNAFTQRTHRSGGRDRDQRFSIPNTPAGGFPGGLGGFLGGSGLTLDDLDRLTGNNRNGSRTTHYDKATLQIGYQLTPLLRLLAQGGLEDDYQPDGSNDRFGSTLWNVGFRYATQSSALEARVGHRFFGTSYFVQASHSGRFFDTSIEYRQEPSSQALNTLNDNATASRTSFAQPATSPFNRGVFLQKRLAVSLGLHRAITDATVRFYRQKREYQTNGIQDQTFTGGNLQIDYQVRPRILIRPNADLQHRDRQSGGGGGYDTADVGITAVRALTPTAQASIGYDHSWRNADNNASEYDENRVIIQLRKSF